MMTFFSKVYEYVTSGTSQTERHRIRCSLFTLLYDLAQLQRNIQALSTDVYIDRCACVYASRGILSAPTLLKRPAVFELGDLYQKL
jgi:hypothetical protein